MTSFTVDTLYFFFGAICLFEIRRDSFFFRRSNYIFWIFLQPKTMNTETETYARKLL